MNERQRTAVLTRLIEELNKAKSWAGETHVQKSVFFLQELFNVPAGFDFMIYKYGPFSFDLRDELTAMRADRLVQLESQLPPYGPSFVLDAGAKHLISRFPKTLGRLDGVIRDAAKRLGRRDVSELERLATALWVRKREGLDRDADCVKRLRKLKPHVSQEEAKRALGEVGRWIEEHS